MEKTNLWPRPLDEKNLTTDWIEEMFESGGWMPTPYCKNGTYQYLTYIGETLVKVSWKFGENQLSFIVLVDIEGCDKYLNEKAKTAIDKIISMIESWEKEVNEYASESCEDMLTIRYNEEKNRIDLFFYWLPNESR